MKWTTKLGPYSPNQSLQRNPDSSPPLPSRKTEKSSASGNSIAEDIISPSFHASASHTQRSGPRTLQPVVAHEDARSPDTANRDTGSVLQNRTRRHHPTGPPYQTRHPANSAPETRCLPIQSPTVATESLPAPPATKPWRPAETDVCYTNRISETAARNLIFSLFCSTRGGRGRRHCRASATGPSDDRADSSKKP